MRSAARATREPECGGAGCRGPHERVRTYANSCPRQDPPNRERRLCAGGHVAPLFLHLRLKAGKFPPKDWPPETSCQGLWRL